jgi:Mn2+/Fe2+ NRAMP family transporter
LPVVLISMIIMVNDRKLMGAHVNNRFQNIVGWTSTVVLVVMTAILIGEQVFSAIFK